MFLSFFYRCGGTAGAVVTCPLEVVKTRLQSSNSGFPKSPDHWVECQRAIKQGKASLVARAGARKHLVAVPLQAQPVTAATQGGYFPTTSHWNIVNKKNKLKLPRAIFTDFLGQQSAVKNNFSVYPQSLHLPGWRFKTLWLLSGVDKLVAGRPCPEVGSIINPHSTSLWPRLVTGTAFTTSTSLVTWPPAG